MKLSRITHFIAAMLLLTLEAAAHDVNKLYLGDVTGMKSRSVDVPLYVENTNPDVAALQFDIAVPAGVTLSTTSSDCIIDYTRSTDHRMSVRALTSSESGRTYRIIMLSPMNSKFKANKGKVATFKANISSTASLTEGETYPFTVTGAVLSDSLGSNVLTAQLAMPCLLCTDGEINTPRLPSYKRKCWAKEQKDLIRVLSLDDFADTDATHYGLTGSPTQVERIFPPEKNSEHVFWEGNGADLGSKVADLLKQKKFI